MYNHNSASPYAPPQQNQTYGGPPRGAQRPRQAPRNTASKSYVNTVARSSKDNEIRLDILTERLDYIEAFLSKRFSPNYEPHAVFRARENLTFATTEMTTPWPAPNAFDSPVWPPAHQEHTPAEFCRGGGDNTPRTSKSSGLEKGQNLSEMADQIREVKGLVMQIMETNKASE